MGGAVAASVAAACWITGSYDALVVHPGAGDGGADALPTEAGDGAVGWCATETPVPVFCDDFDETPLAAGWMTFDVQAGTLVLDPDASVSPPLSLLASKLDSDAGARARAQSVLAAMPRYVHIDVQILIGQNSANGASLLSLKLSPSYQLTLIGTRSSLSASGTNLEIDESYSADGGPYYNTLPEVYLLPTGTWARVRLDVTLATPDAGPAAGSAGFVQVTVDDDASPTIQGPLTPMLDGQPGMLVTLGLADWGGSAGWTVHYDNFAVALTPF